MLTMETMLETLGKFDLHYPEANKLAILELLAHDYLREFSKTRQDVWDEAVHQALRVCPYFPSIANMVVAVEKAELVVRDRRPALPEHHSGKTEEQNAQNRASLATLMAGLNSQTTRQ